MHKSVRIGDYFGNDDNGLWSWYLTNIRNGDFEELTGNRLKYSLFTRFLRTHLDPVSNARQDTKVLIVSISESIRSDITLLELFLHDYLHLDNMEISKLSTSRVYNHENHYVVTDKENNFENSEFLSLGQSEVPTNGLVVSDDGKGAGCVRKDNFSEKPIRLEKDGDKEPLEDADGDDGSLIINFGRRHHSHNLHSANECLVGDDENQNGKLEEGVEKCRSCGHQETHVGIVEDDDDEKSVGSYHPETDSSAMVEGFKGQPITLTMAGTEAGFSSSDGYDSMDSSHSSIDTDLSSYNEDCSLTSVLPSISIEDSFGHFRLVLQSVLFISTVHNEIFTAIRQSNNKPTKASVDDDWLLYDSQFSMHNLQMLTLQDLSELNEGCPKVLFYSLVEVFDGESCEDSETECESISNISSTALTGGLSASSVSHEPRGFFPFSAGSADASTCRLAKDNTNGSTIGHRSIVTTTSAADFGGQSIASYRTNTPIQKCDPALQSDSRDASRSVSMVGRTRSSPLPTDLRKSNSSDRRRSRWRGRFVHGHKNAVRRFTDDKGCVIC